MSQKTDDRASGVPGLAPALDIYDAYLAEHPEIFEDDTGIGHGRGAGAPRYFLTPKQLRNRKKRVWLVEGILPENGLVFISGTPAAGKTAVVLSLLTSLVAGEGYFANHFRVARPCRVAYLCGEKFDGIPERVLAALRNEGLSDDVSLFIKEEIPQLFDQRQDANVERFIREAKADFPDGLDAIVIDTYAAATVGADDIDTKATKSIVANLQRIVRELGCAVITLHHPAKYHSRGLRGNGALLGAIDTLIDVVADNSGRHILCGKQSDIEQFQSVSFQLRRSDEHEAAIVEWGDVETRRVKSADSVRSVVHVRNVLTEHMGIRMTASEIAQSTGLAEATVRGSISRRGNTTPQINWEPRDPSQPPSKTNPNVYWIESVPNASALAN